MTTDIPAYLRRTGRTSIFNSAASAACVVVLLPFIIRSVGLTSYGFWSMLNLFVALGSLLDLGLTKALVYGIRQREHESAKLFATSFAITTAATLLTAILLFYGLLMHWGVFGSAVMQQGDLCWWLATCGMITLFAQLTTTLLRGVLEAHYKSDVVNLGFAAFSIAFYSTGAVIAHFTSDPRALLAGSACVFVVTLLVHLAAVHRLTHIGFGIPSRVAAKSLIRYGLGAILFDIPSILIVPIFQYDLQRIGADGRSYGVFDLAARIATLAATTLSSLSSPFFALVAGTPAERADEMRRKVDRQLRLSLVLGGLGWCSFALLGSWALAVFFQSRDPVLYRITMILLGGAAILATVEPATRMLLGLKRLHGLVAVRAFMLIVALLAGWALERLPVLYRFSTALAIGYAAAALAIYWLYRREAWGRNGMSRGRAPTDRSVVR